MPSTQVLTEEPDRVARARPHELLERRRVAVDRRATDERLTNRGLTRARLFSSVSFSSLVSNPVTATAS